MKPHVFILSCFMLIGFASAAQNADTIYTLRNEKIACKVYEIGQVEIKYKKIENPDGPFYTVLRERVRMIRYANGYEEIILPDEMDVHKEEPIMNKRSVVKLDLFSPMFDLISVGYERVLKPGINVEAKLGFINNSMFNFSFDNSNGGYMRNNLIQGGCGKIGIKLLLGSHTYTPGAKYRHPLHGTYVGFYIGQSVFTVRNVHFNLYGPYPYPFPQPTTMLVTDVNVGSTSFTVNIGQQVVLANMFTLGVSLGVGYSVNYQRYSNPEAYNLINRYPQTYSTEYNLDNYYTHVMLGGGNSPIAVTGSFTLGYILK